MSDLNAAALLRTDTRTVNVRFQAEGGNLSPGIYTYVTDIPNLSEGDAVAVYVGEPGTPKHKLMVAFVASVDDDLMIEPKSDTKYKWVVAKINRDQYDHNMQVNAEIEEELRKNYRAAGRREFQHMMLASMNPEAASRLSQLMNPNATLAAPAPAKTTRRTKKTS